MEKRSSAGRVAVGVDELFPSARESEVECDCEPGRFHLAELTARTGAREVVVDLEKHLQAGVAEKRLPVFSLRSSSCVGQVLDNKQEFDTEAGSLRRGVFDHLHAFEAGKLVEQVRLNAVRNVRARF